MTSICVIFGLFVMSLSTHVLAFSSMLECYRPFQLGHVIMDVEVEHDSSLSLVVKNANNEVITHYTPGEQITLTSTPFMKQIVYEIKSGNAVFVDGTCDGKRSTKPKSHIVTTGGSSDEIVVHALWAVNFYDGVQLSDALHIRPVSMNGDL